MLTHDLRLVQVLFVSGVGGPLDSEVVLRYALKPALPVVVANQMDIFLERQAESERAQLSGERREGVAFYVGMLFKHRKFHYLGLIKDWDVSGLCFVKQFAVLISTFFQVDVRGDGGMDPSNAGR